MTARKTHDADLCERIRALEERVKELEAAPKTTYVFQPPHWCFSGCPIHYPTITWQPNTPYWWTASTTGTSPTDSTITYTLGDTSS